MDVVIPADGPVEWPVLTFDSDLVSIDERQRDEFNGCAISGSTSSSSSSGSGLPAVPALAVPASVVTVPAAAVQAVTAVAACPSPQTVLEIWNLRIT
jgi:hypothetical protein